MKDVMTVTGPVPAESLGMTLMHEHVLISMPGDHLDPASTWSRAQCVDTAVTRMRELLEVGVRTFVDPCPVELGRDPVLLREVSERSGMQIVCATGFYMEQDGFGIPYYWRQRYAEEIAEFYLHEIEHGIGDSGVRPGVIKLATSDPVGFHEPKVMAAAAIASRESGLPVITHTENSVGGEIQLEALLGGGVPAGRCLIGHQDQQADLARLATIAEAGASIGIDRVGLSTLVPDTVRADTVAALVAQGLTGRICLSQDHACSIRSARPTRWVPKNRLEEYWRDIHPRLMTDMVDRSHTYLFTDFLPMLRERGVPEAAVTTMLVDNPRRIFTS
ncbi:MAG TPA: hypothetical protein VHC18_10695 [Amycolatopsis sp.]|nr:hypothetical protein [Amycolatopsis sp.]